MPPELRTPHHHHRERRFHRPPAALGFGYHSFDVARRLSPESAGVPPDALDPEGVSEREKVHQSSRKVVELCAGVLLFVYWLYTVIQNWTLWQTWLSH